MNSTQVLEKECLTAHELVLFYIISLKNTGIDAIPYGDYQIIDEWIHAANFQIEKLLVILSEVLPLYFVSPHNARAPLAGVQKKVLRLIAARCH